MIPKNRQSVLLLNDWALLRKQTTKSHLRILESAVSLLEEHLRLTAVLRILADRDFEHFTLRSKSRKKQSVGGDERQCQRQRQGQCRGRVTPRLSVVCDRQHNYNHTHSSVTPGYCVCALLLLVIIIGGADCLGAIPVPALSPAREGSLFSPPTSPF